MNILVLSIQIMNSNTLVKPFSLEPEIGKVVGTHQGAHYFTVGQRKGLQVGGTPEALFVIGVDTT